MKRLIILFSINLAMDSYAFEFVEKSMNPIVKKDISEAEEQPLPIISHPEDNSAILDIKISTETEDIGPIFKPQNAQANLPLDVLEGLAPTNTPPNAANP